MQDPLDQALNYLDQLSEPELLEMALKHTSFNAWVAELCRNAHEDGVTVACSLYIRPLAKFLEQQRAEMQQAVRVERAGGYGDTELCKQMEWAIGRIGALLNSL